MIQGPFLLTFGVYLDFSALKANYDECEFQFIYFLQLVCIRVLYIDCLLRPPGTSSVYKAGWFSAKYS